MANEWPKTMKRGPLRGQTFQTSQEYLEALKQYREQNPDDGTGKARGPRTARKTREGPVSLAMATGVVQFGNLVLQMIPQTREDALEEYEQQALALAIVETAKVNRFFANIIIRLTSASAGTRLGVTVGGIVAVRLAKRDIVPVPIGLAASAMLYSLSQQDVAPFEPVEVPDPNQETPPQPEANAA